MTPNGRKVNGGARARAEIVQRRRTATHRPFRVTRHNGGWGSASAAGERRRRPLRCGRTALRRRPAMSSAADIGELSTVHVDHRQPHFERAGASPRVACPGARLRPMPGGQARGGSGLLRLVAADCGQRETGLLPTCRCGRGVTRYAPLPNAPTGRGHT